MEIEQLTAQSPAGLYHEVAKLHVEVITGGFLSTLGIDLLESLYRAAVNSNQAFIQVAREQDKLLGFICGSYNTSKLYRSIVLQVWPRLAVKVVPRFFNVTFIRKCIETVIYPSRQRQDLPEQEIINFCVSPGSQGKGVGRQLFAGSVERFSEQGVLKFKIVTGERQLQAQRFYARTGAQRVGEIDLHKGSRSLVFTFDVRSAAVGPIGATSIL